MLDARCNFFPTTDEGEKSAQRSMVGDQRGCAGRSQLCAADVNTACHVRRLTSEIGRASAGAPPKSWCSRFAKFLQPRRTTEQQLTMADDGMLLNFSIPDSGILNKPSFKGGNWKQRLTAKKAATHWHTKATERLTGVTAPKAPLPLSTQATDVNRTELGPRVARPHHEHHDERPTKRPRVGGDNHRSTEEDGTAADFRPHTDANVVKNLAARQDGSKGGKQIISSLFSFNPTSTTLAEPTKASEEDAPVEPSNAPLTSELDTFTSLGISPTLAAHLLKKMDMKAPTAIQKAAVSQLLKDDSDAFIQAETGSGKTLAYLLPIVQRLMELSANMKKRKVDESVSRDSGLFAIILAPTRELSKQIANVLDNLLRCAHWLVATTVIGGEKKKSEKARLRKGINILVATPGRLADHLEHTKALDVSNVRWLVLDEGDRLMELGFEEEIQKIVGNLNLRMRAQKDEKLKIPGLPAKRTTVLCSATMKLDVERLGEISLKDAVHIRPNPADRADDELINKEDQAFFAPAQLKQSFAVVAPKLRLVSLISFLKRAFARKGSVMKAIVFISCADSVDFHFDILTSKLDEEAATKEEVKEEKEEGEDGKKTKKKPVVQSDPTKIAVTYAESPSLSARTHKVTAYRLHGSLPQALRTSTLAHFTKNSEPAVLLATDVASRGLDLPNVDLVVEFDPAFAREDHLHRIGRTARAGRDGRACIFLMPGCEEGYVDILKSDRKDGETGLHIGRQDADEILKKGLVTSGVMKDKTEYMEKATDLQLAVERWALASPARLESARRAYQSHVRAYATHVAAERCYFDIKQLHLGHLAKAFALRERPSGMKVPGLRTGAGRENKTPAKVRGAATGANKSAVASKPAVEDVKVDDTEEAARMRKAVRAREKFMRHAGTPQIMPRRPRQVDTRQSTLHFSSSSRTSCPLPADKAPTSSISATSETKPSRADVLPIASSDAPLTPPPSQLSNPPVLPATLAMETSFELPDSTDWLQTSLPSFEPLEAALRCEICKEFYNNPVITSCAHTFCSLCIRRCIATDGKCPACKAACQADKLQPNIAVREIATKFQDARPKALGLARANDKDADGTQPTPSGRKRKRETNGEGEGEGEGRRTTRSRQTRRGKRLDEEESITNDMTVVIPDSDDENGDEYIPDGMVPCPICNKPMKEEAVFNHIPVCPAAQEDDGVRKTRSRKNAFPTALETRKKESGPPPTRLSGLHYPMLNEKALRKKLHELSIPSWGSKPVMIKRHQEWLNLYNANCDASDDVRKTKRVLLKELDEWERTQGGSASTKESHIMRKDFDGQSYATTHKSQFDDLIENAKKRARANAEAKDDKTDEQQTQPGNVGTDTHGPPPRPNIAESSPAPPHPYEGNEAALSTIRQKVEEANRTDSTFPASNHEAEAASSTAAQDTRQDEVPLGFSACSKDPFTNPTRKVPMFRMPEEPVVDVESSTTMQ
ncbi:hypothetical protein BU23DRAFT_574369 [Bimuria novae-zelandiae CBS 107.79]|uniref:Multifunctional fusion protein n=1 Tax=Bimuria novae-zelandiae CBS 107.79 TaxID=1447943 RepID=A0A6A5UMV7_9PLEO|nr:hypothetical protein BU23DRAFT_574369 [Bimuria novae-zelandiae CBS 107.79]